MDREVAPKLLVGQCVDDLWASTMLRSTAAAQAAVKWDHGLEGWDVVVGVDCGGLGLWWWRRFGFGFWSWG